MLHRIPFCLGYACLTLLLAFGIIPHLPTPLAQNVAAAVIPVVTLPVTIGIALLVSRMLPTEPLTPGVMHLALCQLYWVPGVPPKLERESIYKAKRVVFKPEDILRSRRKPIAWETEWRELLSKCRVPGENRWDAEAVVRHDGEIKELISKLEAFA